MIAHQQNYSVSSTTSAAGPTQPGATSLSGTQTEIGNLEVNVNQQIPANSSGLQVSAAFTAANVQSIFMVCNQNITIQTNSTSAPGNTIALKAGIPLLWSVSAGYFSNPFTANVTSFYVTNTTACKLQIKILTS